MTYVQIEDCFPDNPHIDRLSDAAFRLHVAGICHCGKHLTDGFVADDRVQRLVPKFRKAALGELLDSGRWVRAVGGYLIHDYLKHQRSKAQVEAEKEAAKKRAHEWRTRERTNGKRTGARTRTTNASDAAKQASDDAQLCDEHQQRHPCIGCAADRKARGA